MRKKTIWLIVLTLIFFVTGAGNTGAAANGPDAVKGEKLVMLGLPSNAASGNTWKYAVITGKGKVSAASTEAYEEYVKARDNTEVIESIVPGNMPFVFQGKKAGEVELKFTYANHKIKNAKPELMQIVKINIFDDKTLAITGSASVDLEKNVVAIILPADATSENVWKYTVKGKGKIQESTWDEYQKQQIARSVDQGSGETLTTLPEEIPPGSAAYVFKGVKQGEAELQLTYADPKNKKAKPEMAETVKIEVFPDKTLAVISSTLPMDLGM